MTLPARPAQPLTVPQKGEHSVFSRIDFVPEDPPSPAFTGKRVDTSRASVARERRLNGRLVVDGERTYHAYSADELIEIESISHRGRPGVPF